MSSLVNGAWQHACVQNWHAEGRLEDGDMPGINSHAMWRVRQLMRRRMRGGPPGHRRADGSDTPVMGASGNPASCGFVAKLTQPGSPASPCCT